MNIDPFPQRIRPDKGVAVTGFGVMLGRSRRSVDPSGFGVMLRWSRGSMTRSESASCEFPQLTSSCFGTVYSSMAEPKKGVARIPVPPRIQSKVEDSGHREAGQTEQRHEDAASPGVHMLMSGVVDAKRDPLVVPLVGLLLAFSVISLIVQLLIAFS